MYPMKKTLFLLIYCCSFSTIYGQDFNFNQFQFTPLLLGPQYAAINTSVSAMYRKENNRSILSQYDRYALSYNNRFTIANETFGLGLSLGHNRYYLESKDHSLGLALAYQFRPFKLGSETTMKVFVGQEVKFQNTDIYNSDLRWPSQIGPNGFDPTIPPEQYFSVNYLDISSGASVLFEKGQSNLSMGLSVFHINMPEVNFFSVKKEKSYRVQSVLMADLYLTETWSIMPKFLVTKYGEQAYYNIGTNIAYTLTGSSKIVVGSGVTSDNAYLYSGLQIGKINVGVNFAFAKSKGFEMNNALELGSHVRF
jgi:type IX secretion system PorP/SprF family membrane protein